ncbi:rna-binding protein [Cystoisospora suis]|uniref:Rna-binding protein n=1 Tax=Cystoisospora suis TaxID=483139 RepID=A0A2C6LEA9_9APIC|nr:rna-binding protein [Cystoisospora suis]
MAAAASSAATLGGSGSPWRAAGSSLLPPTAGGIGTPTASFPGSFQRAGPSPPPPHVTPPPVPTTLHAPPFIPGLRPSAPSAAAIGMPSLSGAGPWPWPDGVSPFPSQQQQQTVLPPSQLTVANAEIAALVDLYQQQLAEINAEHSLLLEDQAKLAAFIAPYLDSDGRVIGEFDDTVLLFKQGLDLRLLEYEEDCRRIQQTERRLQRKIDDVCLRYESMVMEAHGFAESRLLGQVKDLQRVIWLLHSELDELRFQRDIYADETKRLRGICRFGHWIEDGYGIPDREDIASDERNLHRRHLRGSREAAQHGVILRPATSEPEHERRAAKRTVGTGSSGLVSRPLKVGDSRITWQQSRGSQRQGEGDEAERRPREQETTKKKEEPTRPSLFQGVLSKLLKPFEDGEEVALEKGESAERIEAEMPAGGVVFSRDVKSKERRSTKSAQPFRRSASTLAGDGPAERAAPPCAIDFAQAEEDAKRRRSKALQYDDEVDRRARRPSGAVSRAPERQDERQPARRHGEDVRDRRRSSLFEKQKIDEDGVDVRERPDVLPRAEDSRPSVLDVESRDRRRMSRRASKEFARRSSADVEYPKEKRRVYGDDEDSREDVTAAPPRRKSSLHEKKEGADRTKDTKIDHAEVPRRKSGFSAPAPDWETEKGAERGGRASEEPGFTSSKDYAEPRSRRPWGGDEQSLKREETEPESMPPSIRDEESVSDARSAWADDASDFTPAAEDSRSSPRRRSTSNGRGVRSLTGSAPAPPPESPYYNAREPRQKEPEGLARRFASRTIASPFVQSVAPSPRTSPRVPISRQVSAAFLGAVESPLPSARGHSPRPSPSDRRHRSSRGRGDVSDRPGGRVWRSPSRTLASPLASARGSYGGAVGLGAPRRMLSVASRGDWDEYSPRADSVYGDGGPDSARPQVSPLDLSKIRR